jgi:hypothetical protein
MNSAGDLRNIKTKRILKPSLRDGYHRVRLYNEGNKKYICLHRAVACLFIPNPEGKPCVDHKYGEKLNNSVDNLRWVTRSENGMNSKISKNNRSGHKNIFLTIQHGKPVWHIQIMVNRKKIHGGHFPRDSEEPPAEVIAIRDELLKQYHGEHASTRLTR